MEPFRKILVAVDFSIHSAEAIRYAGDISNRYDGDVTLVHVFEPIAFALSEGEALSSATQIGNMLSHFDDKLIQVMAEARAAGAPRVDTKLLEGVPSAEIVSFAARDNYSLIVMGTHGRTGLRHALIGSVAERVVRKARCPVLTVRVPEPSSGG